MAEERGGERRSTKREERRGGEEEEERGDRGREQWSVLGEDVRLTGNKKEESKSNKSNEMKI